MGTKDRHFLFDKWKFELVEGKRRGFGGGGEEAIPTINNVVNFYSSRDEERRRNDIRRAKTFQKSHHVNEKYSLLYLSADSAKKEIYKLGFPFCS